MSEALVFKGSLELAVPTATPVFTDVSAEVTKVRLMQTRADVEIPPTLATSKSHGGGARTYSIEIDYFATDGTDGALFPKLWTAILSDDKELSFRLQFRDGAISSVNPEWQGTFIVSGADLGGDVGALSAGSISCTLTDAPTRDITP